MLGLGSMFGQIKPNFICGIDLYQWYKNPKSSITHEKGSSSGSFLLNFPVGLKVLMGANNVSVSVEGSANLGLFSLDLGNYKGLGAVSFPFLVKLNFDGMSGFSKNKLIGYSIGGGIQYSHTEWYGLHTAFKNLERKYFPSYIGEIAVGGGINKVNLSYYLRIGVGKDGAFSLNNGLIFNFDLFKSKGKKPGAQPENSTHKS
jgi:hypothetical protein